jgi:hypothetical protein
MKEIHSPWVSWESPFATTPGADVIQRFPSLLGTRKTGPDLESRVTKGNQEWAAVRAQFLSTMKGPDPKAPVAPAPSASATVAEVLRPLFCTLEVNLQSASTSKTLSAIPASFFVDPIWGVKDEVKVDDAAYQAALTKNGQQILDQTGCGKSCEMTIGKKPLDNISDTFFAFTYPIRSLEDSDYVNTLVQNNVITEDFAKDVLNVDFARPIFSPDRCSLLKFAPRGNASDFDAAQIHDGFVDALKKAGADQNDPQTDASAKLLANLTTSGDGERHAADASALVSACARRSSAVLDDALAYAAHLRSSTRVLRTKTVRDGTLGIIDFAETLAIDTQPDTTAGWDAKCALK